MPIFPLPNAVSSVWALGLARVESSLLRRLLPGLTTPCVSCQTPAAASDSLGAWELTSVHLCRPGPTGPGSARPGINNLLGAPSPSVACKQNNRKHEGWLKIHWTLLLYIYFEWPSKVASGMAIKIMIKSTNGRHQLLIAFVNSALIINHQSK